jgi:hypothetical protein
VCKRHEFLVLVVFAILTHGANAPAQTLTGRLSNLLTEQQPSSVFTPDAAAAAVTRDTVAGLFSIELATLPVASSSGGFVYRLNRSLGSVERASNGFGPFFTESVLRGSREQTGISLRYQAASFKSLQGADLTSGTFPTNATRLTGAAEPFSVDSLQLNLDARTVSVVGGFGISDRLSIGGTVPITNVRFRGQRVRSLNGLSTLQSSQAGSSTGLGDISVQGRYRLIDHGVRGVSVGADIRLPSGREEDLLGAGKTAGRVLAVASWEEGQLGVHLNGGAGVGGVSREYFWSTATTFAATPRLTVIGEMIGRRLSELSRLQDVYQPYPDLGGLETMRWLPIKRGIDTTFIVVGAKWNVMRSCLINTNVLIRLTDSGLRARVTPTISLDFDFQR